MEIGSKQQPGSDTVKEKLLSPSLATFCDLIKPFQVYSDASDFMLEADLAQKTDGKEGMICCVFHYLNWAEQKFSMTKKECLPIVRDSGHLDIFRWDNCFRF